MSDNKRKRRIEELIKRELGMLLLAYPKNSIFNKVTITAVDVAPNLSTANVFFSVFDDVEVKSAQKILQIEDKILRRSIARTINLRITPKLNFIYDDSIKYGKRISDLIDAAVSSDENSQL